MRRSRNCINKRQLEETELSCNESIIDLNKLQTSLNFVPHQEPAEEETYNFEGKTPRLKPMNDTKYMEVIINHDNMFPS